MSLHGRHSRRHSPWMPVLVVFATALAVALVAVVAVVAWQLGTDPDVSSAGGKSAGGGGATTTGEPSDGGSTAGSADPGSSAETLHRCQSAWAREVEVGLAADATLDQWRLHIDAMNQLVAGQITLAQASAYWDQTRIGAKHKVKAFRRLDSRLRHEAMGCTMAEARGTRAEHCAHAVQAYQRVFADARPAVTTWAGHIREMEQLRDGEISPDQAVEMWRMMWHQGMHELARYERSSKAAVSADCGA